MRLVWDMILPYTAMHVSVCEQDAAGMGYDITIWGRAGEGPCDTPVAVGARGGAGRGGHPMAWRMKRNQLRPL